MPAKLSPTVIVTGPKDDPLANDGRGATPTTTINKIKPQSNNNAVDGLLATAKPIASSKIESSILKKLKNPKLSDDQALQSLERSIGTRLVSIYGNTVQGQAAQRQAVSAFQLDLTGRDRNKMRDAGGRVVDVWDRADPSSVTSLSRAVQSITRDVSGTGLIDTKGKFATALGLLDMAVALGVPQLIDDIIRYVQLNKAVKKRLIESVRQVILRSDLRTLNKILDLVGASGVLQRVPDAISLLLTFYRFSWGTKPEDYRDRRSELLSTLNRISPTWSQVERRGVLIGDLTQTNYMSPAAKTLFLLVEPNTTDENYLEQPYVLETLMAGAYPFTRIDQLSLKLYPELAIWGGA